MIRQPIVCVMGHVDHGKTSLLDAIRKTTVAKREAGAITQHIGASEVPTEVVRGVCAPELGEKACAGLKIPGLLFIDTPGHEAFTNLRRRGGSLADIAILVVDVMQGFQPQTLEALSILKEYKTPFIIAANKMDLINGWNAQATRSFMKSFNAQPDWVQARFEEKVYELIGRLGTLGFESERYDRVQDYRKAIAIVPVSAKTGEGIAELLMLLSGLSQKFLEEQLEIEVTGPAKGSVLEVKDEKGLGKTMDVIIYEGVIRKGDEIAFGTLQGAATTKVRGLLKPKPLDEMRDPREKFNYADEVSAASGVKIYAPGLDEALPGSPVFVVNDENRAAVAEEIGREISGVLVESTGPGLVVKADTLGSIEGLRHLLSAADIPVRRAGIGPVTKKDVMDAVGAKAQNRYYGALLAFSVEAMAEAREEAGKNRVAILESDVIYTLLENYQKWVEVERAVEKKEAYASMVLPAKIRIMPGCCFRAKSPVIVGIEVIQGRLRPGCKLMTSSGTEIGELKSMQKEKEQVTEGKQGDQFAIAIDTNMTFGRQLNEGDILFTFVPKDHYNLLKTKFREHMGEGELSLLDDIRRMAGDTFIV